MNPVSEAIAVQDFSYDPFDPADPLPFYRVLRDEHPVYYLPTWDTYALSRFDDIWDVLAVNDGTFVASEGTLPAAAVLATRNDGPVPDPPLHPLPFHANFDAPVYDPVRRCTSRQAEADAFARAHPDLLSNYLTHTFDVDDVQAAFDLASRPTPGRIKIAINR